MGKGCAQLGKPVKGKSKERKKDRKAKTGDAQLVDDIKLLEEYERLNKLADAQRLRLKRLQQQEMYNTKINQNILLNVHRKAMRAEKLDSLRKEIEILAQNFEREVDRKDAILQMLTKDIAQAEEQYDTARRTHLTKIQQFMQLHEQKLHAVNAEFERYVKALKAEYHSELEQVRQQHARETRELASVIAQVETLDGAQTASTKSAQEAERERVRNANLESINELRISLENRIEDLEKQFDDAHNIYTDHTYEKHRLFRELQRSDRRLTLRVQARRRRLDRLQAELQVWRRKLAFSETENERTQTDLAAQRDLVKKQCAALKAATQTMREGEAKRLTELSLMARDAGKKNAERLEFAEKLLHLAELARKLETEKEKVMPVDVHATAGAAALLQGRTSAEGVLEATLQQQTLQGTTLPAHMTGVLTGASAAGDDADAASAAAAGGAGGAAGGADGGLGFGLGFGLGASSDNLKGLIDEQEWSSLDPFYAKYNKVLLDKLAIAQEKARLKQENVDLRGILKQYLDGIAVNAETISQTNPLLIVNGRVSLMGDAGTATVRSGARRPNVVIESGQVMHQYQHV